MGKLLNGWCPRETLLNRTLLSVIGDTSTGDVLGGHCSTGGVLGGHFSWWFPKGTLLNGWRPRWTLQRVVP